MKKRVLSYFITAGLAVLITALILLFVYDTGNLYPFGDKNIAWCDMNQQVVPLLMNFKNILVGESNMFLNLQNAGGMNFFGVFFFFLASPFSFLVALVDYADMLTFMNILALIKFCVAAITASLFFHRCFDRLGMLANASLSVSYALCGFGLMYYQNIIWLDVLWCFPLVMLGLYLLALQRKPLLFIVSLGLFMVINYYIGYMLVLFILIGASLWLVLCTKREDRVTIAVLFAVSCFCAALITAVIWLPSLLSYTCSARGTDIISSLSSGDFLGPFTTKFSLLLCTPLAFAAIPFAIKASPTDRQKHLNWCLIMMGLLLIASAIEPINKMWHTGSYQAFPLRYGFITIFIGLIIVAFVITEGVNIKQRTHVLSAMLGIVSILAILRCSSIINKNNYSEATAFTSSLWCNDKSYAVVLPWFFIALLAFCIIIALFKFKKISKCVFSALLSVAICVCCVFNTHLYIGSITRDDDSFVNITALADQIDDCCFYRVKSDKKYFDVNMTGALGYNSLSHYTSLTREDYMFAMKKLGYSSYWMEVNSNGGTILTDAILQNRYIITTNELSSWSNDVVYKGTYNIIKNSLSMPAAVRLISHPSETEFLPHYTRRELQEYIYTLYGGTGTLTQEYEPTSTANITLTKNTNSYVINKETDGYGYISYNIFVNGKQSLYFDIFKDLTTRLKEPFNEAFSITVNGRLIQSDYPSQKSNGILCLGDFENRNVSITITVKKDIFATSFGLFSMDYNKVVDLCQSTVGCDISVNGNTISCAIEGNGDDYLYLCLPYDKGYSATVNGKTVNVNRVNDSFIAVKLENGDNRIVLTFVPQGFTEGVVISIVGMLMLVAFLLLIRRFICKRFGAASTRAVTIVAWIVFGIMIEMVYVFPLMIYFK